MVLLRIIQGISVGGEWGGAALMAVEHAPARRRGLAGSMPQLGVPLGLLLATAVTALMTGVISPGDQFLEWGWRVPFIASTALIAIGYFVRIAVDESPVFQEIAAEKEQASVPIVELFRKHWHLVVLAALILVGNNAVGYMSTGGFIPAYATSDAVGHARTDVLVAMTFAATVWLVFTLIAGIVSDRIGRKLTYQIGYVWLILTLWPLFLLIDSGSLVNLYIGLGLICIGTGLTYGPQALLDATGGTPAIAVYLIGMCVVALVAVSLVRDRSRSDLSINNQAEQEIGSTVFDKRPVPVQPRWTSDAD